MFITGLYKITIIALIGICKTIPECPKINPENVISTNLETLILKIFLLGPNTKSFLQHCQEDLNLQITYLHFTHIMLRKVHIMSTHNAEKITIF